MPLYVVNFTPSDNGIAEATTITTTTSDLFGCSRLSF